MPSSLNLNGLRFYRPGVYANIDASALGGQGVSSGNVALVGAFPSFEHNEAITFTSAGALRDYDITDKELALIGKLSFSPSIDANVPGGAQSLTMLNVQPNTCANFIMTNNNADEVATISAKVWGLKGNNTFFSFSHDSNGYDLTCSRNGLTEAYSNITSGEVCSIEYTGSNLDRVSLDLTDTSNLLITWGKDISLNSANYGPVTLTDMRFNGKLGVKLDAAPNANVVITVNGYKTDGAIATETITLSNNTQAYSTNNYASIYGLSVANSAQAGLVLTLSGEAFDMDLTTFDLVSDVVDFIQQASVDHFTASYLASKSYDATSLDGGLSTFDIKGQEAIIKADLQELIDTVANSAIISIARSGSNACDAMIDNAGQYMLGGSQTNVVLSDWTASLELIETSDIQIIVAWSSLVDVHKEVVKHCNASAVKGFERNAWVGALASQTIEAIKENWVKALNNRNIAIVGQSVKLSNPEGKIVTLEPKYLALILACMQAGTPVATPLTRKRPDVLDVLGSWVANRDATDAIKAGITCLTSDSLGWRVERSVTTWIKDNNPIYSEVSANESINASVRELRSVLDAFIGQGNSVSTISAIKGIASENLRSQVDRSIIKAFKDLVLEDLGDTVRVNYTVAAVEPLNFILINASVRRF
jgi:hypothetical protein